MTKTKPYYLLFLLLLALPAHAQLRYELKVAPLWGLKGYSYEQVLSRNTVEGSFEWLLGKKFGVEAGVAHRRNRCVEPYFYSNQLENLEWNALVFSLYARFYVTGNQQRQRGLFIGIHTSWFRNYGYPSEIFSISGLGVSIAGDDQREHGTLVGYKFVVKNKWVVEPGVTMCKKYFFLDTREDFRAAMYLKLGFRNDKKQIQHER